MRKSVFALAFALVAALGIYVPSVSAAPLSTAKVVIVVGAVGSQTASFRASGDAIYAEAIKYSSNVTRVYSPNATWSRVKAAITGANIVVYLGHGNGYPSPYATAPRSISQNGFGLNDSTLTDYKHVYYGERYFSGWTDSEGWHEGVKLAPNALVLLNRLCYASGAGEPGDPNPTTTVARERVSNYAAGFLKAGARAVIADGHRSVASYIRQAFTTNTTIDQLWRTTNQYGNIKTFASTRSTGYTGYTDPKYPDRDYYRSMVAKPTLTTREIIGVVGDTGLDPAAFAVPGRASVTVDGAELLAFDGAIATPVATLSAGTRLKTISRPTWAAPVDLIPVLQVEGLDDPSITGFVRTSQLAPRDSTAPILLGVDASPAAISPNGDGKYDTTQLSARFSESVAWTLRATNATGAEVAKVTGTGKEPVVPWNGLVGDAAVPDGTYTYTFSGRDAWLNGPEVTRSGTVKVDTTAPVLTSFAAAADSVPWFSPNGDTSRETFAIQAGTSESGRIAVRVRDAADTTIRTFSVNVAKGDFAVAWNGRDNDGRVARNGLYSVRITPIDGLENVGTSETTTVRVLNLLGSVASSKSLIFPQDLDALASSTALSFKLDRSATVTWTIRNKAGAVVATLLDRATLPAGTHSRTFSGRTPQGAMLPTGAYTSHVSATDGESTIAHAASFSMMAFQTSTSSSTATRGRSITIRAVSAEALSSSVNLRTSQPGKSSWTVKMTKLSTGAHRATVTLKTGGSAGTVTFRVLATDARGRTNSTYITLPLK